MIEPAGEVGASGTSDAVDDALLVAVLSALAGIRRGERVAAVGAGPLLSAALLAMCGRDDLADEDAHVVVAPAPADVPLGVRRLAPGGRLVSLAPDAGAAQRAAAEHGLVLRHAEHLDGAIAWSAVDLGPVG